MEGCEHSLKIAQLFQPTETALSNPSLEGTVRHWFVHTEAIHTLFSLIASQSIWHLSFQILLEAFEEKKW